MVSKLNTLLFVLGFLWKHINSFPRDKEQLFIISDPYEQYVAKYELDDEGHYHFVANLPPSPEELEKITEDAALNRLSGRVIVERERRVSVSYQIYFCDDEKRNCSVKSIFHSEGVMKVELPERND